MSCKFKPDLNAFEALQKTQPVDKYVVQYQRKKKKKKKNLHNGYYLTRIKVLLWASLSIGAKN